jgi:pilus assembly protein Flp/PilA
VAEGDGGKVPESQIKSLLLDEDGATALEYGLMAAAIAGVLMIVAFLLGRNAYNVINKVAAHLN